MKSHYEPPDDKVTILVRNNGPLRVYGPARLVDAEGNEYEIPPGDWFTLCRCGRSERKPFCDSTHKNIDFDAPSVARPLTEE
jgi:CDGSH-type Zn-finger protein